MLVGPSPKTRRRLLTEPHAVFVRWQFALLVVVGASDLLDLPSCPDAPTRTPLSRDEQLSFSWPTGICPSPGSLSTSYLEHVYRWMRGALSFIPLRFCLILATRPHYSYAIEAMRAQNSPRFFTCTCVCMLASETGRTDDQRPGGEQMRRIGESSARNGRHTTTILLVADP